MNTLKIASYHCNDFDFEEHVKLLKHHALPPVEPWAENIFPNVRNSENTIENEYTKENSEWNMFYSEHLTADVYKPRRYLVPEFYQWLHRINNLNIKESDRGCVIGGTILEVGCGHGSTVQPLLSAFENIQFKLTDYSQVALKLLSRNIEQPGDSIGTESIQLSTTNVICDSVSINDSVSIKQLSSRQRRKLNKLKMHNPVDSSTISGAGVIKKEFAHRIMFQQWDITQPYVEIKDSDRHIINPSAHSDVDECSNDVGIVGIGGDTMCSLSSTPVSHDIDGIMCVFVLSAVHSDCHYQSMCHMKNILKRASSACSNDGGVLMFRDYGIYDMTMLRHRRRIGQNLYIRNNTTTSSAHTNTFAFYFDLDYLRELALRVGFKVIELEYATVLNCNKKAKAKAATVSEVDSSLELDVKCLHSSEMRRVFVHGVFMRID